MKYLNIILFASLGFLFALSSCSSGSSVEDFKSTPVNILGKESTKAEADAKSSINQSSPAYERGLAVGRGITSIEPESPQREQALIEAHGMASSLRRNGYARSADEFVRGIEDAMAADKL